MEVMRVLGTLALATTYGDIGRYREMKGDEGRCREMRVLGTLALATLW
jgi:hypothetical protein